MNYGFARLFLPPRVILVTREVERVEHGADSGINGEAYPRHQASQKVDAERTHLLEHFQDHDRVFEEGFAG